MSSGRFRESCYRLNFCWLVPYVWACSKPADSCRLQWPEMPYDDVCAVREDVKRSSCLPLFISLLLVCLFLLVPLCLSVSVSLLMPLSLSVSVSPFYPSVSLSICLLSHQSLLATAPLFDVSLQLPFPFFFSSHACKYTECQIIHTDLSRSHNFPFITPTVITQKHKTIQLLIRAESAHTNPPYAPSRPFFASVFILLHQVHTPCLCSQPAKGGARWRRSITVTEA